ncbi:HAMP domain-containing histidine kinase [Subsaximicrobium wynnwilliamsii]|uniref:histidine kinase n=1 Tax=Subsaximicrobium wynnwilliamsii TaxID=291179 RepID=A0A5C6ZHC0_9FLAO|nr:HAMP domain-containing sensor histidine kinase [Subsaximicrobium wynnwilliamsii]TXD83176.1 HAMP domain-containing histidine kinase [Subsaximicrobium wynnwilliamsii]TXD88289.1 HAMP domain-containing histidine kinase [Subsaximicrobium wynnwilliamsii]TXE03010.1 HAMP domain-containing histidine kinase [Subsaximicrobium wynnwilliamsii]
MTYKSYVFSLTIRVLGLLLALILLAFGIAWVKTYVIIGGGILSVIAVYHLYRFMVKRFVEVDDFFESIKYRDFSRWFVETKGPQDIRELHKGFNLVNKTIKAIDSERQAQFVYLQKILEMVNIGLIAYNVETGEVLWTNDSFLKTLDFPAFKNISFIEKRAAKIYDELFETYHSNTTSVTLELRQESLKVLISDTVFEMESHSFKLIVLQNIEDTLNRNESEAWKKLLSVMTHEIMNSIAPITSLAETLQKNIQQSIEHPKTTSLELEDVNAGLNSIKKRSAGLMKFAKTYRSLNKITHVNKTKIKVSELFDNISELMKPSLEDREVQLIFKLDDPNLLFEIDAYLIEQVLINLILNAFDATESVVKPQITVSAAIGYKGAAQIKVSDNGKGIPAEIMDSIFVPFFSTKKTGSGIGLSLCKQIMLLHGGKIQLQSIEHEGTVVSLLF